MDQPKASVIPPVTIREKFPIGIHLVLLVVIISFAGELGQAMSGSITNELWNWAAIVLSPFIFYGLIKRRVWAKWLVIILFGIAFISSGMLLFSSNNMSVILVDLISMAVFLAIMAYVYKKQGFFGS